MEVAEVAVGAVAVAAIEAQSPQLRRSGVSEVGLKWKRRTIKWPAVFALAQCL